MIKKTLYFGNPAYLSLRNAQLVIKLPEVEKCASLSEGFKKQTGATKPIKDIGVVVLDHKQITITSGAMEALLENKCAVVTCDSRSMPVGWMLPLYGNTTQNERFRHQLSASLPLRKQLWKQTVQTKIHNQASVLRNCTKEAWAAAYYWKSLFQNVDEFTRDRNGIPPTICWTTATPFFEP